MWAGSGSPRWGRAVRGPVNENGGLGSYLCRRGAQRPFNPEPNMKHPIKFICPLRRDFAVEVGWHQAVTSVVEERSWRQGRLPAGVGEKLGPTKVGSYRAYVDAMVKLQVNLPDRLMLYALWRPAGQSEAVGFVSSREFGANVETGWFGPTNHLLRELFDRAEQVYGAGLGDHSPLRPRGLLEAEAAPRVCLVHDTKTTALHAMEWSAAFCLVRQQDGGGGLYQNMRRLGLLSDDDE